MIDLHTHSIFSDGALIPSESAQRALAAGYKTIAITDHADCSNLDFIVPRIIRACAAITGKGRIQVLPGLELTHVDPSDIAPLAAEARAMGAKIIIVHGETLTEPVPAGTNLAAIKANVDILAHPGLITDEEARLAAQNGGFVEITTRRGHSLSNGHVAKMATKYGAPLILNNDAHAPADYVGPQMAHKIARGAGLSEMEVAAMLENSGKLAQKAGV